MRVLILLLIVAMLSSCSPQFRFRRLVKKYPELVEVKTTTANIEVIIPGVIWNDTLMLNTIDSIERNDTITIEKERLRIRYVPRIDSFYLEGECLLDTVYKEVIVKEEVIVDASKNVKWWEILLYILGGYLLLKLIIDSRKK